MLTNQTKPSSTARGRDVELALIEEKLRSARDGNGATLILDGAAGFGKTRLLAEALTLASGFDVKGRFGAVPPADRAVPLGGLRRRPDSNEPASSEASTSA